MTLVASITTAGRSLRMNVLRSALAMLGIIVGVAALITMVAVGFGAQARVAEQLQYLGSNVIIILPGSAVSGRLRLGLGTRLTVTEDDAVAIEREIPTVQVASASSRGPAQLVAGNANWSTTVTGIGPGYLEARDWHVESGGPFTAEELNGTRKVMLLGRTPAQQLFGDADPVGRMVRIKRVPFTVVGVLAAKGPNAAGQDQDDNAFLPLATAKTKILGINPVNARSVTGISVKVHPDASMAETEHEIRELLRQRHRLQLFDDDDFVLRNLDDVRQAQEAASETMTYLLGAIAAVSLLVGGIGIMNVMLASITERTREIGVRLAVGARGRDIVAQFLLEALMLALVGGLAGIALGVAGAHAITFLADWDTVVAPSAIAIAFGVTAAIGIASGLYPALRAARLDPIEALRAE
jgi:putative ABC transport system permease protein